MASDSLPVINDHDLLTQIGRGSYGVVWKARNALGTLRAVKIVDRAQFDNDRPYVREFSGIQKFEPISRSHEGLVDILQVGRNDAENFFYYVMELADPALPTPGTDAATLPYSPRTLASDLKSLGRIRVSDALPVFLTLIRALGHLHTHGLLHRDIKPANVIFVGGVAKLADIGLVAEAGGPRTFVGTEGFIPPEGPGSISADIYAFGKLMYEVVAGRDRNEFPALTLDRTTPEDTEALVEFNAVLLRCCDPDPQKRYRRAAELQADLELLQSGHSVQRLRAFERRLGMARVAGLAAIAVASLAVLISLIARRQERITHANLQNAELLQSRAEGAERLAKEQLYASLLARAAAERRSGLAGARGRALAAVRQAGRLAAASPELRSEAISALALTDFTESRRWRLPAPRTGQSQCLSRDGSLRAQVIPGEIIEIRRVANDELVETIPPGGAKIFWLGPFSSDSRWLRIVREENEHQIWDRRTKGFVRDIKNLPRLTCFFVPGTTELLWWSGRAGHIDDLTGTNSRAITLPMEPKPVSISPDGRFAAMGRWDTNRVDIIDLTSGIVDRELRMTGHLGVTSLEWSPDGQELAAGTADHRIAIVRPSDPQVPWRVFVGHGAEVVTLVWSPNGKILVSGSWDGTIRIWSVREVRELERHLSPSSILGFTMDSAHLALYEAASSELVLWDVHSDEVARDLVEPVPDHFKTPYRAMFTTDSEWLLTGTSDGIRAYHVPDGAASWVCKEPQVMDVEMFPSPSRQIVIDSIKGQWLSSWQTNQDGELALSPLRKADPEELVRLHPTRQPWLEVERDWMKVHFGDRPPIELAGSSALYAEVSPDGRYVAASARTGHAMLWTLSQSPTIRDFGPARSYGIAFSPDSRRVFYATSYELWSMDTASGAAVWHTRLSETPHPNTAIRVSADGRYAATVMNPYEVSLVDAQNGRPLATIQHPELQPINDIAFSPDGNWFAVACTTHVTHLWDLRRVHAELAAMNIDWKAGGAGY